MIVFISKCKNAKRAMIFPVGHTAWIFNLDPREIGREN